MNKVVEDYHGDLKQLAAQILALQKDVASLETRLAAARAERDRLAAELKKRSNKTPAEVKDDGGAARPGAGRRSEGLRREWLNSTAR